MSKQLVAFVLFWGFTLFRIPVPAVGDIESETRCTVQDSTLRNELRTTTTCSDHGAAVSFTTVSNTQETSVDYVCTSESGETITRSPWTEQTSIANVRFRVSVTEQLQPGTNCTFYVCYWYIDSPFTQVFGRESPASCITDTDECATNNGGCEVNCINTIGSFHCSCPIGYHLDEDGFNCNDTDECATNNGGCEFNCTNTIGSFNCSCPTGYYLDEDGFNCNETNECATNNGGCEQMCNNTIGSFHCSCRTGYLLDEDGFNCSDINECENGDDNCNENANCTNTEGSFTCSCNLGYAGDGVICTNINECSTDNGGCEHSCTDTIGSFNCICDVGYLLDGNGFNCNDINECENGDDNCNENANCTNTEGSFTCSCSPGYSRDGVNCMIPSETTMIIVTSVVGIIALLIAALFVVFCAAHQFRRKDSTMFTDKVYLTDVLDPKYLPVSTDTVPKLSTLPSMSSMFDTLCKTDNTHISNTDTSSTSEIQATYKTLDTVLYDNSTDVADVVSDTEHVNCQMPINRVGVSHDTLLMTETGTSSTSYLNEEREESCSTSGLEKNTQTDGEELVICDSNSPDACAVSRTSAKYLSSGDTTGMATVKQSSDYIICEDLLVGSDRPLSIFDLDDHVSESELPPSVGLETGFHDQKSLTFSNEETENQEYFQTTKFQPHPGYLPNTHLLSSAKKNVDSFGGQQSASSGRDGLRTDMKSPPNSFPLSPHHCRTPSESDYFNDIMHNQLDASSLSQMQYLSGSSGYIMECSGSGARENGRTLP